VSNRKNGKIKTKAERLEKIKNQAIDITMIGEKDRLISEVPITTIQINGDLQLGKNTELTNDVIRGVKVVIRIEGSRGHPLTIGNNKVSVTKGKLREVDLSLPIESRKETTRPKAITNREDQMIIIKVAIATIRNPIGRVNLIETTTIVTEMYQVKRND
jgi:hypothetical protein